MNLNIIIDDSFQLLRKVKWSFSIIRKIKKIKHYRL